MGITPFCCLSTPSRFLEAGHAQGLRNDHLCVPHVTPVTHAIFFPQLSCSEVGNIRSGKSLQPQNHGMKTGQAGKDHTGSSGPTSWLRQGHPGAHCTGLGGS